MPSISKKADRRPSFLSFRRFIIVHQELGETCTGIDEGASLEELSEQILYYYDYSLQNEDSGGSLVFSDCTKLEAVRFAGVCSALHSLPNAMLASTDDDVARHVHLAGATLVFVPLEGSILAVAQVLRASSNPDGADGHGGGNTLAIKTSIQRCHELFCLIRGGGINHQLPMGGHIELRIRNLFELRRRKRSLDEQLSKLSPSLEDEQGMLKNNIDQLKEEIKMLICSLPLQSLRQKLRIHYDEYISELETLTSNGGVAGRCIVDHVPVPAASDPRHLLPHSTLDDKVNTLLRRSIEQMLVDIDRDYCDEKHCLLGVSFFFDDRLVFSLFSPSFSPQEQGVSKETDKDFILSISPQTVTLLHGYIISFRNRMSRKLNSFSTAAFSSSTPPPLSSQVSRLGSCVSDGFEEKTVSSTSTAESRREETVSTGSFLEPPLLSMLSASDQIFEVHVPSLSRLPVWMPRTHLPVVSSQDALDCRCGFMQSHVALFEAGRLSFLLYIQPRDIASNDTPDAMADNSGPFLEDSGLARQNERNHPDAAKDSKRRSLLAESLASASPLLEDLSDRLSFCIQLVTGAGSDQRERMLSSPTMFVCGKDLKWDEPGQVIVFVDRNEHTTITNLDVVPTGRQTADGKMKRFSLNFLGIRRSSGSEIMSVKGWSKGSDVSHARWPPLRLDSQQILVSHLPLDAVLALDDAMNEVHRLLHDESRRWALNKKGAECGSSPQQLPTESQEVHDDTLEICTFLPQGWMFAHASKGRELYILFGTDVYVTIADVQNAAFRIRRKLFEQV